jgi:predicted transglutaminase-like protease
MDYLRNRWLRLYTDTLAIIDHKYSVNVIRHHYHRVDRYTFMVTANILQNGLHRFAEWVQLDCSFVNIA